MKKANGLAGARIVLPAAGVSLDQASYIEIACSVPMTPKEFTLMVSFRIPRTGSGLPAEMTTIERRLGPQCRGLLSFAGPAGPRGVSMRVGEAEIVTGMLVETGFMQSDEPVARRMEPPCEIATHTVDPKEARITATNDDSTEVERIVDLMSSPAGREVEVAIAGRVEQQIFPLTGAALAIAEFKRACAAQ
jgi:hypothetical protein